MNKIIIIENWLPEDLAEDVANRIEKINDWSIRICDKDKGPRIVDPSVLGQLGFFPEDYASSTIPSLVNLARQGTMAYLFFVKALIQFDPSLYRMFHTDLIPKVNEVMGQNNTYLEEPQVTMYTSGCFLGQHSDGVGNRNVAFIANFSRGWQPDFGGCLTILEGGEWKTIPPKFNSLVLMDVRAGSCHYVSQVATWVNKKRIAITGWLG